LPNLKVQIKSIFSQLFAPMQPTEKPIVGAQVLKYTSSSIGRTPAGFLPIEVISHT